MELLLPPLIAYGPAESMALALAAGCDDYLCEPWSPAELFNRGIRSVTSTALHVSGNSLICGPDRVLRQTAVPAEKNILKVSPQSIRLTRAEAMILKVLIRNKGRFISRSVFAGLLGCSTVNGSRAVDMHVSRLRKKVSALIRENCNDQPDCPIRSASGYGWTIDP